MGRGNSRTDVKETGQKGWNGFLELEKLQAFSSLGAEPLLSLSNT